ncbi:MAG: hypothetical protein FJX52_07275 [Alphaproteobacteria bacterium]|nr:hypothetical protein [Alphaproteobacteria bacterium]
MLEKGRVFAFEQFAKLFAHMRADPADGNNGPSRPTNGEILNKATVPPQVAGPVRATTGLGLSGKVVDGREGYMRDTLMAVASELTGALERHPTGEEIGDAAWPQYEAHVDLSRPGRGRDEFYAKAAYLAQRLATGAVGGAPTLAEAIQQYRARQQERARQEAPGAHPNGPPPPPGSNGEWKWEDDEPLKAGPQPRQGPQPFGLTPVGATAADGIPPRNWIYGRHLIGGFVSLTVAPGGTGKTALVMAEAVAIATGKPLFGETVHETGPVSHYNLEDPLDELRRRLAGILRHFKVDIREVAGQLYLNSGRDRELIVAKKLTGIGGGVVAMPDADALAAEIKRHGIIALSIDPFVRSHYVNENDNAEVDFVAKIYGQIANCTGAAIDLAHHVRKPPAGGAHAEGDINQARGASSMASAARAARTLSPMSLDDAAKLGVPEEMRRGLIRVDDAKANMAPPRARAMWLRFHSVDIENAVGLKMSDHVGVLAPWTPTPVEALMLPADQDAVLKEFDGAFVAGNGYSPYNRDKEPRRYGLAFERAMPGRTPGKSIQARVVKHWLENTPPLLEKVQLETKTPTVKAGRTVLCVLWENVHAAGKEPL